MRAESDLCLASTMILNEQPLPIQFFYRDWPKHKGDSGFRFYSGYESDVFLQEDDAACVAPLSALVRLDPSIAQLIDMSVVGCVWERHPEHGQWMPVIDYIIP